MSIIQSIERVLFGASAEEAVALRLKLIDLRVEERLAQLADALAEGEDTESEGATGEGEGSAG